MSKFDSQGVKGLRVCINMTKGAHTQHNLCMIHFALLHVTSTTVQTTKTKHNSRQNLMKILNQTCHIYNEQERKVSKKRQ